MMPHGKQISIAVDVPERRHKTSHPTYDLFSGNQLGNATIDIENG
jgi:hypothetical protein